MKYSAVTINPSEVLPLSREQQDFFSNNGFLHIKQFFSPEICTLLKERIEDLLHQDHQSIPKTIFSGSSQSHAQKKYFLDSGDKIHYFFEPDAFDAEGKPTRPFASSINKIGHALHENDPVFRKYSRDSRLKQIAHQLGLKTIALAQSMYIFKQPEIGAEVPYHQDSTYVYGNSKDGLGFWIAIEDATVENGCLEVIPGPTNTALKQRMTRTGDETHIEHYDQTPWDDSKGIPLPAAKGDLIVLHGRLPHKSNANLSDKSRHAYAMHMIDISEPYPENMWLQWPAGVPVL